MIIENHRKTIIADALNVGSCFIEGGEFYIKTDERFETESIKCVNLKTGKTAPLPRNARVEVINAKVVIE